MSDFAVRAERPNLPSIEDLRRRISAGVTAVGGIETVPLAQARGRVLAEALVTRRALPVFDHSAMDGYALALSPERRTYDLVDLHAARLAPGEACPILTGAPLPPGADAVARREQVEAAKGSIRPLRPLTSGVDIRRAGEDVAEGAELVPGNRLIDSRHIAIAAAAGISHLPVRRRLRLALASAGAEFAEADETLGPGRIHDSDRPMLAAALDQPALAIHDAGILPEDGPALAAELTALASESDLIVLTAGAFAGEADRLAGIIAAAGGALAFVHPPTRPGKPLGHGRIAGAGLAVLRGNPFGALVSALLFVRPMIEQALGLAPRPFAPLPAAAGFASPRTPHRCEFLPARIVDHDAAGLPIIERLGRGGSARLKPLIDADGLAVVAAGEEPVRPGARIGYLPFDTAFSL